MGGGSKGTVQAGLQELTFPNVVLNHSFGAADYDWQLQELAGKEINLSQYKGRVVFLNIWATWCPPCVAEMPSIQALHDSLKEEGVVFLAVSDEDEDTVMEFARENKLTIPMYLNKGPVPAAYRTHGIPATFILNPEGNIAFKHVGSANWDTEKSRLFLQSFVGETLQGN